MGIKSIWVVDQGSGGHGLMQAASGGGAAGGGAGAAAQGGGLAGATANLS
jgi:hypothetical protein